MWLALVALWGRIEPGTSANAVHRLARGLRSRWRAGLEHPFDWAKE
jgi:hypothetical protein